MDFNNFTARSRSWVGNVCQKVEDVIQEVDSIMKQKNSNQVAEQGQKSKKKVKNSSAKIPDPVLSPRSFLISEDQVLQRDKTVSTSSILCALEDFKDKNIQVKNLTLNMNEKTTEFASSVANDEDRLVHVNNSLVNFADTPPRNSSEQSQAEPSVTLKNDSDGQSCGPDDVNQLADLSSADGSEGQSENCWEFNGMDFENNQDGELSFQSLLVTPSAGNPLKVPEYGICEGISSTTTGDVGMLAGEIAVNEDFAASNLRSISSIVEELCDACEPVQLLSDSRETTSGSEAKLSLASCSSVHGVEPPILFSHDETDRASLSEQSSGKCSEEKRPTMGFERSIDPPVVQSIDNSGALLERFSGKNDSPYILSATDYSSDYLLGINMETVSLTDDVEELEENVDIINSKELYALSIRSFKKKLRDAITRKKRLAKEYKHLGIWYGNIDIRLDKETQPSPSTSASPITLELKSSQKPDCIESEWVLL